ncbi:MAG TPA: hypothetical protein VGD21_08285 [Lysobacter sp.]
MKTIVGLDPNGRGLVARLSDGHFVTAPTAEVLAQHLRMLGIPREEVFFADASDRARSMSPDRQAAVLEAWTKGAPPVPGFEEEGEEHYWDVTIAIRDVSFDIAHHIGDGTAPDRKHLVEWLSWLNLAARLHYRLEDACEDLIEEGSSPERLKAMEAALARAQGQENYCRRRDRW